MAWSVRWCACSTGAASTRASVSPRSRPRPAPRYMFGAFTLDLTGLGDSNPVCLLPAPQEHIEKVLAERAVELGVDLRRGQEVTDVQQEDDFVRITLADGETFTTRYLVGADGGHSMVRRLSGIDFPGVTTDDFITCSAHVSVADEHLGPDGSLRVPGYGTLPPLLYVRTEYGTIAWGLLPDRVPVLNTTETGSPDEYTTPMTFEEMMASAERVLGVPVPLAPPQGEGPHLLRRLLGGNTRLAERYRDGRVLLLGDAAHVHSAIGGPGLNLGLQDAFNLGWKLAATVHGWAPEGLLDTYDEERRPVAEHVVASTLSQSALMRPGPEVGALRTVFGALLATPGGTEHIAHLLMRHHRGIRTRPRDPHRRRHPPTGRRDHHRPLFAAGPERRLRRGRAALARPGRRHKRQGRRHERDRSPATPRLPHSLDRNRTERRQRPAIRAVPMVRRTAERRPSRAPIERGSAPLPGENGLCDRTRVR